MRDKKKHWKKIGLRSQGLTIQVCAVLNLQPENRDYKMGKKTINDCEIADNKLKLFFDKMEQHVGMFLCEKDAVQATIKVIEAMMLTTEWKRNSLDLTFLRSCKTFNAVDEYLFKTIQSLSRYTDR